MIRLPNSRIPHSLWQVAAIDWSIDLWGHRPSTTWPGKREAKQCICSNHFHHSRAYRGGGGRPGWLGRDVSENSRHGWGISVRLRLDNQSGRKDGIYLAYISIMYIYIYNYIHIYYTFMYNLYIHMEGFIIGYNQQYNKNMIFVSVWNWGSPLCAVSLGLWWLISGLDQTRFTSHHIWNDDPKWQLFLMCGSLARLWDSVGQDLWCCILSSLHMCDTMALTILPFGNDVVGQVKTRRFGKYNKEEATSNSSFAS